ncbi:MAG: hypothetical protein FWF54_08710 [Candidatus Azobacteroides sp.]|nr:hypothetical protein [Candidatus Azobacteroides sp.]
MTIGILKKYVGLDFLFKHWWALHTDDKYFTLRDLYADCLENGGLYKKDWTEIYELLKQK